MKMKQKDIDVTDFLPREKDQSKNFEKGGESRVTLSFTSV